MRITKIFAMSAAVLGAVTLSADIPNPGSFSKKVPTAYKNNNSPFSASVGICQETENQTADQVNNIANNFKMVHIYQYDTTILNKAKDSKMEVLLGTSIDEAKSFTTQANADAYVTGKIIPYKDVIKAIAIGNESNIAATYIDSNTFNTAACNLAQALKNQGLEDKIYVTATLVYGCTQNSIPNGSKYFPPECMIFQPSGSVDNGIYSPIPYINAIKVANPKKPFVFYDFYPHYAYDGNRTPDMLKYCLFQGPCTDSNYATSFCGLFDAQYLSACNATYAVCQNMEVYVGEVGWPNNFPDTTTGQQDQADFINNFYNCWVKPQNKTIPVFLFYAYPNRADNSFYSLYTNPGINFGNYSQYNK